jgi:hypothetical protein
MLDAVVVGIVVAGAVFFLGWNFRPRRRAAASLPCGSCGCSTDPKPAPVKLK